MSSSSTTGSSGCLVRWMNDRQLALAGFTFRDSWIAVRSENDSSTMAIRRMTTATPRLSTSWGWRSFSMPS